MSTVTEPDQVQGADWEAWRTVGCGVEALHHVLTQADVDVNLSEVLRAALAADGYDDALGWRHRALVEVAAAHGVPGEIVSGLDVDTLTHNGGSVWLVSVTAPEQFACTHLVAPDSRDGRLDVFWPQVHPQFGGRFLADPRWFGPKMTGRGTQFEVSA